MTNKEFEEFVVREGLSIGEIEDLIDPYAEIDLEEGSVVLHDEYRDAEVRIQLLIPLLAFQAFKQADKVESAAINPVDLAELTASSVGKAYPVIRELEQAGVIENVGKEYQIVPDSSDQIHTQFESAGTPEPAD